MKEYYPFNVNEPFLDFLKGPPGPEGPPGPVGPPGPQGSTSDNAKVSSLNLGDKWRLSGVGDAHGNDDWLRFFNKDGNDYYGGIATQKLWVGEGIHSRPHFHHGLSIGSQKSLCLGKWCFEEEADGRLYLKHNGSKLARFANTQDRFVIYKDLNGKGPYFYVNSQNNFGGHGGTNEAP